MTFYIASLTVEHCQQLCQWRYPSPYEIYQWPAWGDMMKEQREFADPLIQETQYTAVLDDESELVGFAQFFPMEGVTRLGLGLRPNLCNGGQGEHFVNVIIEEALRRTPSNEIDLEVMTWNLRAQNVYEKAGFVVTDTYERNTPTGRCEFHCMVYRAGANETNQLVEFKEE